MEACCGRASNGVCAWHSADASSFWFYGEGAAPKSCVIPWTIHLFIFAGTVQGHLLVKFFLFLWQHLSPPPLCVHHQRPSLGSQLPPETIFIIPALRGHVSREPLKLAELGPDKSPLPIWWGADPENKVCGQDWYDFFEYSLITKRLGWAQDRTLTWHG